jgi:DNA-directed RNA polymerase subunit RPC12/RpoP
MESLGYAVCEHCAFLRAFGRTASGMQAPERCPACGHQIQLHSRRERFPSAYVGRASRKLHRTPPLSA